MLFLLTLFYFSLGQLEPFMVSEQYFHLNMHAFETFFFARKRQKPSGMYFSWTWSAWVIYCNYMCIHEPGTFNLIHFLSISLRWKRARTFSTKHKEGKEDCRSEGSTYSCAIFSSRGELWTWMRAHKKQKQNVGEINNTQLFILISPLCVFSAVLWRKLLRTVMKTLVLPSPKRA